MWLLMRCEKFIDLFFLIHSSMESWADDILCFLYFYILLNNYYAFLPIPCLVKKKQKKKNTFLICFTRTGCNSIVTFGAIKVCMQEMVIRRCRVDPGRLFFFKQAKKKNNVIVAFKFEDAYKKCTRTVELSEKVGHGFMHFIYFPHYGSGSSEGVSFTFSSCTMPIPVPHPALNLYPHEASYKHYH